MIERELDPYVWFGRREVIPIPRHFIKTSVIANDTEIDTWVISKLKGRYGVSLDTSESLTNEQYYYFEDPVEAMIFELRWSGK